MMGNNKPSKEYSVSSSASEAVPVTEEHASVKKKKVKSGKVRVSTATETYEDIARATLQFDHVEIERVPVGKMIEEVPGIRTEGHVVIVPIVEEVVVLEKKLHLKEELYIRRAIGSKPFEQTVALRRQNVVVEHLDSAGNPLVRKDQP